MYGCSINSETKFIKYLYNIFYQTYGWISRYKGINLCPEWKILYVQLNDHFVFNASA